jgi:hypothetical protein
MTVYALATELATDIDTCQYQRMSRPLVLGIGHTPCRCLTWPVVDYGK